LTIVDTGSFAGAARKLNRAVSVISYGIANLEAQLGLTLFDREGTRKPTLTVAGRALLSEARGVAQGIDALRAKVKGLLDGLEAEVDVAVDVMLPTARLGRILRAFRAEFPTVQLRLHVEALGAITAMVLDGKAVIGLSGPLFAGVEGLESVDAGSVQMVPVAAPDHPLAQMDPIPRRGAAIYPARADRPFALYRRAGLFGALTQHMASGRPWRQTCPAARRDRVGQHAIADDCR
jgi:DNA-binding transcriptional LysR family regulator